MQSNDLDTSEKKIDYLIKKISLLEDYIVDLSILDKEEGYIIDLIKAKIYKGPQELSSSNRNNNESDHENDHSQEPII